MKESIRMIAVLTFFALLSGGILGWFNTFTEKRVEENRLRELLSSLQAVTGMDPKTDTYEVIKKEKDFELYRIISGTKTKAYAIVGEGNGYQDKIRLIFGVSPDFSKILALKILEEKDTPGLGARIESEEYLSQWKGKAANGSLKLVKTPTQNPYEVQAITGATISSTAVLDIVNKSVLRAKKILKEGGK